MNADEITFENRYDCNFCRVRGLLLVPSLPQLFSKHTFIKLTHRKLIFVGTVLEKVIY